MALPQKKLFNPTGDDRKENKRMVGGNTTNIMDFGDTKYPVFVNIYDLMQDAFWKVSEVRLSNDVQLYRKMEKNKKDTFDSMISFLVFLDSLQCSNLQYINNYITASEVNLCLTVQAMQETTHSHSYSAILTEVVETERRSEVLNQWRDNEYLLKRNEYIGSIYNNFIEYPTMHNFLRALIANYALEGIYFYSNFAFFYHLQRLGETDGISQIIRMINRDELNHVTLFANIINVIKVEDREYFTEEFTNELRDIIVEALRSEKEWARMIIGDKIEGLNCEDVCDYVEYLTNLRLKDIGFEPISDLDIDPLPWILTLSQNSSVVTDFFEGRNVSYSGITAFRDDL